MHWLMHVYAMRHKMSGHGGGGRCRRAADTRAIETEVKINSKRCLGSCSWIVQALRSESVVLLRLCSWLEVNRQDAGIWDAAHDGAGGASIDLNDDIGTSDLERSRLPDLVAKLEGAFGSQVSVGGGESSSTKSLGNCSKCLRNPESMFEVGGFVAAVCRWIEMVFEIVCCGLFT
jgi:hypothetical protein